MTVKTVIHNHPVYYVRSSLTLTGQIPGYSPEPISLLPKQTLDFRETNPDVVPDWRQKLRRGEFAGTSLTAHKVRCSEKYGVLETLSASTITNGWTRSALFGAAHLNWDVSPFNVTSEAVRIKALQKFLSAYQQSISLFQGGVFSAEFRETLSLITHPGKLLRRSVDRHMSSLKKIRRGQARSSYLKYLSDAWLQYVFGVKPLLADISDGAHALADIVVNRRFRQRIDGTYKDSWYDSYDTGIDGGDNYLEFDIFESYKADISYHYFGEVYLDTGCDAVHILNASGFAPVNWVPTLYEAMPWSFVIDYFTNLGDVISAFSYGTPNLLWSMSTRRVNQRRVREARNLRTSSFFDPNRLIVLLKNTGPQTVVNASSVERSVSPSLVMPLTFRIPGLESTKWINLAALIKTRDRWKYF